MGLGYARFGGWGISFYLSLAAKGSAQHELRMAARPDAQLVLRAPTHPRHPRRSVAESGDLSGFCGTRSRIGYRRPG